MPYLQDGVDPARAGAQRPPRALREAVQGTCCWGGEGVPGEGLLLLQICVSGMQSMRVCLPSQFSQPYSFSQVLGSLSKQDFAPIPVQKTPKSAPKRKQARGSMFVLQAILPVIVHLCLLAECSGGWHQDSTITIVDDGFGACTSVVLGFSHYHFIPCSPSSNWESWLRPQRNGNQRRLGSTVSR